MGKDFDDTEMVTGFRDVNSLIAADAMHDEDEGGWTIDNDRLADWAVSKLHDIEDERKRIHDIYDQRVADLEGSLAKQEEKLDRDKEFFTSKLYSYFNRVETKETKTQRTYKLLSGTLKLNKPKMVFRHDDEKILHSLDLLGVNDFTKTKTSLDWAGLKKALIIDGSDIVDENGEIVNLDGLTIEEEPGKFSIS